MSDKRIASWTTEKLYSMRSFYSWKTTGKGGVGRELEGMGEKLLTYGYHYRDGRPIIKPGTETNDKSGRKTSEGGGEFIQRKGHMCKE